MPGPFCPSCSYDLQTHVSPFGARCPECGSMYSLRELTRSPRRRLVFRTMALVLSVLLAPVFASELIHQAIVMAVTGPTPGWFLFLFCFTLAAIPLIHCVLVWRLTALARSPWPWWARVAASALMTTVSAGLFYLWIHIGAPLIDIIRCCVTCAAIMAIT